MHAPACARRRAFFQEGVPSAATTTCPPGGDLAGAVDGMKRSGMRVASEESNAIAEPAERAEAEMESKQASGDGTEAGGLAQRVQAVLDELRSGLRLDGCDLLFVGVTDDGVL